MLLGINQLHIHVEENHALLRCCNQTAVYTVYKHGQLKGVYKSYEANKRYLLARTNCKWYIHTRSTKKRTKGEGVSGRSLIDPNVQQWKALLLSCLIDCYNLLTYCRGVRHIKFCEVSVLFQTQRKLLPGSHSTFHVLNV